MTWQEAKAQAKAWVESRMAQHPCPQPGDVVRLTDYEDEATHSFLKPEDRWSLTFHRMITKAVGREFRKRGMVVEIVMIRLAEYWSWLEAKNRKDSAAQRAAYINEKI